MRIPPERGPATRIEVRVGDGSANAHLAIAGLLCAALHGLRDELELRPPHEGDAYAAEKPGAAAEARSIRRSTPSRATRFFAS